MSIKLLNCLSIRRRIRVYIRIFIYISVKRGAQIGEYGISCPNSSTFYVTLSERPRAARQV